MIRNRPSLTALVLGILVVAALVVLAPGPARRPVAAAEPTGAEPAEGEASAEELYTRAKQAYVEGNRTQALTDAVAANKKDPEDLRVKYLIYILRREPSGTGSATDSGKPLPPKPGGLKGVTISDKERQTLVKEEGHNVIRQFRGIQRILRRRCAEGECHGATGTGAKWTLALKGPVNERMLAENFRTVSQYFNREEPEQSALLTKPLGGKEVGHPEKAIRGKTDPVYQEIKTYIGKLKTKIKKLWGGEE